VAERPTQPPARELVRTRELVKTCAPGEKFTWPRLVLGQFSYVILQGIRMFARTPPISMQESARNDIAPEVSANLQEIHFVCAAADESFRLFRRFLFEHPPPPGCMPTEWIPRSDQ